MAALFRYKSTFPLVLVASLLAGCAGTEKVPLNVPFSAAGNTRAALDALQLQGQPYVYGGTAPEQGFDCSGLVVYVYNKQGIVLPRTTQSLVQQLPGVRAEQRQPGDLLFFNTEKPYSHVGIYVGNDDFVHAPSARTGRVMVSSLRNPYWRERFMAVRRPQFLQGLSLNVDGENSCRLN
ncbi:C40 family peptidase [Methylomonas sp. SURF-2]|uniref:C40 family peptidase n=1 Tax=Methylomonas subterranea TaxID=2952225 RepID=A0ABT1TFR8_9GAMM|nr:C40 family peptidase [Methylomonas sp. SURF-2]MCQ8104300.1 C40 family peptidase [Methylomonas sp. SURF-2]